MGRVGRTVVLFLAGTLTLALAAETGGAAAAEDLRAAVDQPQVAAAQAARRPPVCLKIQPSKIAKKSPPSRTYGRRKTGCKRGLHRNVLPAAAVTALPAGAITGA